MEVYKCLKNYLNLVRKKKKISNWRSVELNEVENNRRSKIKKNLKIEEVYWIEKQKENIL